MRKALVTLALSGLGLIGIATHEGFSSTAYQDIVGVWTIGFGTTKDVKPQDRIDPVKALQRKAEDIVKFEGAMKQCVSVPLHQHEYDAYVSLAYNIGPSAFCGSTLVRKLNQGDYEGACKEILRWDRAGGRVVKGLAVRREAEYKQCIGQ
jgi:lysozyme